ncbi:class I mannose-6-phosphate isomerase [Devosia sp.]|uniref:class I mannose-6-phosphate isomerase n=1 Tax=Devosia sp. TaxID=1871048 RepID=UPI0026120261|nr:class I mannose-6-phosphate isomerase [Devosia sp.]
MELSSTRVVRKPWGKTDLRPWSELGHDGVAVGELWFQRADRQAPEPDLLLKLLFTEEPLSIQVHPDDTFAKAIGLPHGKTEAWYVLSATAEGRVALGLKRTLTPPQLRAAIEDGSIPELVHWQDVSANEALLVPAGTIHAIGAGLVIAEIQQRSDATFRLFDHGRQRELHLDGAVASSVAGPAIVQTAPVRLSEARNVVAQSPYFVMEQIDLAPSSHWEVDALSETWFLVLEGEAAFDLMQVASGEAMFLKGHRATVRTGERGAKGLMAYVASSPVAGLLQSRNGIPMEVMAKRFPELGLDRPPALPRVGSS